MQVIGFNITKVSSERFSEVRTGFNINTTIEFTNFEKEEIPALDGREASLISFKYNLSFDPSEQKSEQKKTEKKEKNEEKNSLLGTITIEGKIVTLLDKEEFKLFQKNWKKKDLSPGLKFPLFNIILRKCTPKAIELEEEVGLPLHLPIQQFAPAAPESENP